MAEILDLFSLFFLLIKDLFNLNSILRKKNVSHELLIDTYRDNKSLINMSDAELIFLIKILDWSLNEKKI